MTGEPGAVEVAGGRTAGGSYVLSVTGELDLANAPILRAAVDDAVRTSPPCIRFDLGGLSFIDSSGLAALLDAAAAVPRVELVNPSPTVRRLIELTGLGAILPVTS